MFRDKQRSTNWKELAENNGYFDILKLGKLFQHIDYKFFN